MGWVTRRTRDYYYRSRRLPDGRVTTEVHSGLAATLYAKEDEKERRARRRKLAEFAEEEALDAELDQLIARIEEFTIEYLEACGFHRHKRQWRKRRKA